MIYCIDARCAEDQRIDDQLSQTFSLVSLSAGEIVRGYDQRFICSPFRDGVPATDRIGRQVAMMGVQQHDVRAVVEPSIRHQLVDVRLADALLRIVDPRRHALPLGVDDQNDPLALPNDEVRPCAEAPGLAFVETAPMAALRRHTKARAGQRTRQDPFDICFEQDVHLEEQRVTVDSPRARLLVAVR